MCTCAGAVRRRRNGAAGRCLGTEGSGYSGRSGHGAGQPLHSGGKRRTGAEHCRKVHSRRLPGADTGKYGLDFCIGRCRHPASGYITPASAAERTRGHESVCDSDKGHYTGESSHYCVACTGRTDQSAGTGRHSADHRRYLLRKGILLRVPAAQ